MPLYCCAGNMLHGAPPPLHGLKKPPAHKGESPLHCYTGDMLQCAHTPSFAKEPSSMHGGIAHALLYWLGTPPLFGGEEKPSSVQRVLPLYCCTGNMLQALLPLKNIHYNQHQHRPLQPHLCQCLRLHPVVSRLVMYHTKVLMYRTRVLLACLTKVRH
jgi:hypothetical protein